MQITKIISLVHFQKILKSMNVQRLNWQISA